MKNTKLAPWIACAVLLTSISPARSESKLFANFKKAELTRAVNNARQIGLALWEFDANYGSFPSDDTPRLVEKATDKKLPADDETSNAMFRQLFAAAIVETESIFHAKIPGAVKGDDKTEPGKLLAKGENAFAYIAGISSAGNPTTPIVVCPLIPGTTKFDPKPFGGKALILRIDMSVQALPIDEDGRVLVDGIELLSKDHPVWKGKAPDIRYPDLQQPD